MSTRKPEWVRLPTGWIENRGLRVLRWKKGGAENVAGLILLVAIAHRMDQATGSGRVTYDELQAATGLSRTLISAGLRMLTDAKLVDREGKSVISLAAFEPDANYAKLPVRKLYEGNEILAFREFTLRNRTELDALKLYLLFASRRDRSTNVANLSYGKIEEYAGLDRSRIKRAIDLLVVRNLIRVDQQPSRLSEFGMSFGYRLTGLDDYVHAGTRGRSENGAILDFASGDTPF